MVCLAPTPTLHALTHIHMLDCPCLNTHTSRFSLMMVYLAHTDAPYPLHNLSPAAVHCFHNYILTLSGSNTSSIKATWTHSYCSANPSCLTSVIFTSPGQYLYIQVFSWPKLIHVLPCHPCSQMFTDPVSHWYLPFTSSHTAHCNHICLLSPAGLAGDGTFHYTCTAK